MQLDLGDVYERRSAACPYEQERLRRILNALLPVRDDWLMLSVGTLRRYAEGQLSSVCPRSVLRKWRSGCERLVEGGYDPVGFALLEVHLVRPLEGPPVWEPHFHALLAAAPQEAVRAAFAVRPRADSALRNRPVHVQPLTPSDVRTRLRYMLKFQPRETRALENSPRGVWASRLLWGARREEWLAWMSLWGIGDLLSVRGLDTQCVRRAQCCEMAPSIRTGASGYPLIPP